MPPGVRKLALTAHVASSVGWLGAVAAFLALAIAGLAGRELESVRAAYVAMEVIAASVIVPLGFASLATGLVQSLGTPWGLFRHYWVLFKLLLTIVAIVILLVHMRPIRFIAAEAAKPAFSLTDHRPVRIQLVADAGAAVLLLLVNTTLSVFKPRGVTRWGSAGS